MGSEMCIRDRYRSIKNFRAIFSPNHMHGLKLIFSWRSQVPLCNGASLKKIGRRNRKLYVNEAFSTSFSLVPHSAITFEPVVRFSSDLHRCKGELEILNRMSKLDHEHDWERKSFENFLCIDITMIGVLGKISNTFIVGPLERWFLHTIPFP